MKKILKNMLIIVLVLGMIVLLAGCDKEEQKVSENNEVKVQEQTNYTNEVEEKGKLEISMGEWKDNVYSNESIGMKFKLPSGWTYSSEEQIAQIMNIGKELLNDDQKLMAELSELKSVHYMMASDPNTASSVSVIGEKTLIDISMDYYMNQLKQQLLAVETINYEVGETSKEVVAGKEYTTLQLTVPEYQMVQKYYVIKQDNYFTAIIVTSTTGETAINEIMSHFE